MNLKSAAIGSQAGPKELSAGWFIIGWVSREDLGPGVGTFAKG
jgi:hypothetical protein